MKDNDFEKTKYSAEELNEFEEIIWQKLAIARQELSTIQNSLSRKGENDASALRASTSPTENGMEMMEREQLSQLAARQKKFIKQLEDAHVRIKNGTYGICVKTGKLISKDRLRSVPHTTHSIEAKLKRL